MRSALLDPDDLLVSSIEDGHPTLIFRGVGAVHRIHDPTSREIIRNVQPPNMEQYGLGPTELASLLIVLGWVVPCRIPWFEARSMPQGWEFSALWGDNHVHIICYTADTKRRLQVAAEETRVIWMLRLQCFRQMTTFDCTMTAYMTLRPELNGGESFFSCCWMVGMTGQPISLIQIPFISNPPAGLTLSQWFSGVWM